MRWTPGKRSLLSPIGLDIGRCGVRAAQIAWRRGRRRSSPLTPGEWTGIRTGSWEWSAGSKARVVAAGPTELLREVAERQGLAERIRRFLRQHEFRGRAVVVGLSSPEVELHAMELPPAEGAAGGDHLRQAAHWELERLMSFEKGEVQSDYWSLPASKSAPTTALGVAARKDDVEAVTGLCLEAGLECRRVDAGLCALARFAACVRQTSVEAASPVESGPSDDVWGVLDLGYRQSRLALCIETTPVVVRTFDAGCARWIQTLAEVLGLTPETAEVHLRDHGIQPVGRGLRAEDPAAPSAQLGGIIRNVLRPELESLCHEIERSFRYAQQCYPGRPSSELILAGGGSEVRNLAHYLQEKIGIAVVTAAQRWEGGLTPALTPAGVSAGVRPLHPGGSPVGVLACAVGLAVQPGGVDDRR